MRTSLKALLFASLGLFLVQRADASIGMGDIVTVNYGGPHGAPGAFWVDKTSTSPADAYASFCVEKDEFFTPGSPYKVADVNSSIATKGGINTDSGDTISKGTAAIYAGYRGAGDAAWNAFASLNSFSASNLGWGDAVQVVIWRLEEEQATNSYAGSSDNAKVNLLWNWVTAVSGGAGFGGVGTGMGNNPLNLGTLAMGNYTVASGNRVVVMNIKHPTNNAVAQSQLAYGNGDALIPPPEVPEPATIAIWGLGLGIAGLVKLSRRKTKK